VASCALIPQGTFNPAARHSFNGKSVFASWDETGARKRSAPLRPRMMAGRTLRLVKSVNGIGRRTTSFREQVIENVVARVVPGLQQRFFGELQPRLAFDVAGLNSHTHRSVFGQGQRSRQDNSAVFINGINRCRHVESLPAFPGIGKHRFSARKSKSLRIRSASGGSCAASCC